MDDGLGKEGGGGGGGGEGGVSGEGEPARLLELAGHMCTQGKQQGRATHRTQCSQSGCGTVPASMHTGSRQGVHTQAGRLTLQATMSACTTVAAGAPSRGGIKETVPSWMLTCRRSSRRQPGNVMRGSATSGLSESWLRSGGPAEHQQQQSTSSTRACCSDQIERSATLNLC